MCGIAGCIEQNGEINKSKFEKMVDIIEHRGPDDKGVFYENNVALGHRRLSIIDLSADGHQPFFYENRYVVVFNGEIYNYLELREELQKKGQCFRTKTDTEVLAAAYAYWGQRCVEHLNGMWAFAIYDQEKQKIFCSRDRFGVKPFYYTEQEGMFLFASEIKQFYQILEQKPRANRESLLQYIIRGNMDYSGETMFRDVFQLRGGHNLCYDLRRHRYNVTRYYDIRTVKEEKDTYENSCRRFREKFYDSVKLRLRADVSVGYALSGGLDSSSIVCMADKIIKEQGSAEQHTISSCFEDKRYDEQEYIDEVVAKTSAIPHKVFPQETNLFSDLDKIIWHMDEPFGSTSIYAQWNVFETAKENELKVMLDGQGADEQLAGYTGFYKVMVADCLNHKKFRELRREWAIYKTNRAVTEKHISSIGIFKSAVIAVLMSRIPGLNYIQYITKSIYYILKKPPFPYRQFMQGVRDGFSYSTCDAREYIAESFEYGLPSLLHYEDRDSMAHSIESRVPFLDYKLVEAVYAMPFGYKLRNGITKAVLRDGLQGVLPDKIRNRYSKLGFVTPEDQWINHNYDKYRKELKEATDTLRSIIDGDKVMEWFDRNKGQMKRQDFTAWRIICAGHWAKLFQVII